MDPLAHTLVGASLSETRLSRLATPTLILSANAPDIDVVSMAFGRDPSLGFRRGWTHGVLAMVVLPLALAALTVLADRAVASVRRRPPSCENVSVWNDGLHGRDGNRLSRGCASGRSVANRARRRRDYGQGRPGSGQPPYPEDHSLRRFTLSLHRAELNAVSRLQRRDTV